MCKSCWPNGYLWRRPLPVPPCPFPHTSERGSMNVSLDLSSLWSQARCLFWSLPGWKWANSNWPVVPEQCPVRWEQFPSRLSLRSPPGNPFSSSPPTRLERSEMQIHVFRYPIFLLIQHTKQSIVYAFEKRALYTPFCFFTDVITSFLNSLSISLADTVLSLFLKRSRECFPRLNATL